MSRPASDPETRAAGWLNGLAGVLIFSGTIPATRLAIAELDPVFLTWARAAIAGLVGGALLVLLRQPRPGRDDLRPLLVVSIAGVIGFPLLTALALRHITAAHAMVFIGLLPLATALFAVLRAGERPRPPFWFFSALGAAVVAGFALVEAPVGSATGDLLMLGAVAASGLAYAEGAVLTRRLGGWQVISWALVLSLPIMLPLAWYGQPASWVSISRPALLALAYVSLFSMLIGFLFWYRGLVQGGIAAVGQLQLLQPFLGLMLSAVILDEPVGWRVLAATVTVVACVAGARRFAR